MGKFSPEDFVLGLVDEYRSYVKATEGKRIKGRAEYLRQERQDIKYWAIEAKEWRARNGKVRSHEERKRSDSGISKIRVEVPDGRDIQVGLDQQEDVPESQT